MYVVPSLLLLACRSILVRSCCWCTTMNTSTGRTFTSVSRRRPRSWSSMYAAHSSPCTYVHVCAAVCSEDQALYVCNTATLLHTTHTQKPIQQLRCMPTDFCRLCVCMCVTNISNSEYLMYVTADRSWACQFVCDPVVVCMHNTPTP